MGALKASPNQALLVGETNNVQAMRKQKGKEKRNIDFEPKEDFNPVDEASGSNKDKHQRFDKGKCSYYKKGNDTEKYCLKKTIAQMSKILQKHNISLHEEARNVDSRDKTEDHDERFHPLKDGFSKSHAFLINLGASNHMVASKESFSIIITY